ncbi:unnamed protein product [Rotaria magnacalcarata]|nr:unnamed protein product [Rotaria magnacalcarata]
MLIAVIDIGMLFSNVTCFKTGVKFFGQPTSLDITESNHYVITTCALYRIAITYLQHVHDHNDLDAKFQAAGGNCGDFHMIIARELEELDINPIFFRLAREEIALANIMTDLIYDPVSYTHFDNEEFENGVKFVTMLSQAVQSSMARLEWTQARMVFGFMLHSMQDFYSHSNWIELGMREPNKDLTAGRRLGSVADENTKTCKTCLGSDEDCVRNNLRVDNYLTSGYFAHFYPVKKPPGKCHHGYLCYFPGDNNEYCEGISKDGLHAPHGHLHQEAASVAYNATVKVLNELWTSTSTNAFGRFLGLTNASSLVFVIDVSNRLQSLVDMIEVVTSKLVDSVTDLPNNPTNYIVSPFNGSHWGPLHVVTKFSDFLDVIEALNEDELQQSSDHYYDALNEALKACESQSLVFFFTDAPSNKPCSQGPTRALARLKQANIDVLFVNTSKSDIHTINELTDFADSIGGLFINMNITQRTMNQEFIYRRLEEAFGYECILFKSMANHHSGTFMIDRTTTSLRINVVSSSPSLIFRLIDPVGSTLRLTPSLESNYLQIFTIDVTNKSDIGQWNYQCSEDCAIEVNVKSEFRCRTQLYAQLSNDLGEIVATPPLFNQTGAITITTCDKSSEALNSSVELISTDGEILFNYSATDTFVETISVPSKSFRVRTCIGRRDGTLVYREERTLFETTQITMIIDNQPLAAISGKRLNVTYTIQNYAAESLYIQLDINDVLKNAKWYSIMSGAIRNDFVTIDTDQYPLKNETVRFIPLIFTLQAFNNEKIGSGSIVFRHEQIVPFFVQNSEVHLEAPTHLVDTK